MPNGIFSRFARSRRTLTFPGNRHLPRPRSCGGKISPSLNWHPVHCCKIALIDNGFRFVSWVLFSRHFQWWNGRTGGTVEPNKHWGPCHKRVPAVIIECAEAALLPGFL